MGERLSFGIREFERPFSTAGFRKADRSTLAIVKHVRGLVDDHVREAGVAAAKVLDRDVAFRLFAQAEEARSIYREQLCSEAPELEVGSQVVLSQRSSRKTVWMLAGERKTTE